MSAIMSSLTGVLGNLGGTFTNVLNKIISPEKRAELLAKLQSFAINNPKLAAFLTTQIALTGLPLLLFLTFSVTVGLFSLIAALLIGLVAALLFTVFMVGVALLVVLPTVFLTTFAASFIFLWGLGGYYILQWVNEGESPAPEGLGIGDKLNEFSGGRMSWLTEGTRQKQENIAEGIDSKVKVPGSEKSEAHDDAESNGHSNSNGNSKSNGKATEGSAKSTKQADSAPEGASTGKETASNQADGVKQRAAKSGDGAKSAGGTASNTGEAAKGAASSASGT